MPSVPRRLIVGGTFDPRCTHVIVAVTDGTLQLKRTEKSLAAIAAGRWLLREEWLHESVASGAWLPEAPYEVFGTSTQAFGGGTLWLGAPRFYRLRRERGEPGPFAGMALVVATDTKPDQRTLQAILRAGSATVRSKDELTMPDATVDAVVIPQGVTRAVCALAAWACDNRVPCVHPEYVMDRITQETPPTLSERSVRWSETVGGSARMG